MWHFIIRFCSYNHKSIIHKFFHENIIQSWWRDRCKWLKGRLARNREDLGKEKVVYSKYLQCKCVVWCSGLGEQKYVDVVWSSVPQVNGHGRRASISPPYPYTPSLFHACTPSPYPSILQLAFLLLGPSVSLTYCPYIYTSYFWSLHLSWFHYSYPYYP